jgi:hypothetical protein
MCHHHYSGRSGEYEKPSAFDLEYEESLAKQLSTRPQYEKLFRREFRALDSDSQQLAAVTLIDTYSHRVNVLAKAFESLALQMIKSGSISRFRRIVGRDFVIKPLQSSPFLSERERALKSQLATPPTERQVETKSAFLRSLNEESC